MRPVLAVLALIALLLFGDKTMAQSPDVPALVDAALADNPAPGASAAVIAAGDDAVPVLAARLAAAEPSERTDSIALLAAIGSPATVSPLLPLITDDDWDTRERSARAVFAVVIAHGAPDTQDFADAIVESLGDKPGGATLLLAGFVPQARDSLIAHVNDTHLVKLDNAGPTVPASIATMMALALLGEPQARVALDASIPVADPQLLEFYLAAITLIDDPTVLQAPARATLANRTPIGDGLPSGAKPPRRLADRAVDAFVQRLNLRPGFTLTKTGRYSEQDIREIGQLIESAVPQ